MTVITKEQSYKLGITLGWSSLGINIFLFILNLILAYYSGSLSLTAEVAHNGLDFLASVFILIGLWLSQKETKDFPYGLYKIENLVQALIAISIFLVAYEIGKEALFHPERAITVQPFMLLGVLIAILVPFLFSRYEMRVGKEINSPSLIADATEFRAHIVSSSLVFIALAGQLIGLQIDRIAALIIVAWIAYEGWHTMVDAMRVLLDASLDSTTLNKIRGIMLAYPEVTNIKSLTGRNSGRYRFLEAEIQLHVSDLEKAHIITDQIEAEIREEVPYVERILLHAEPETSDTLQAVIPLQADQKSIAKAGEAEWFAFYTIDKQSKNFRLERLEQNPYTHESSGRGIKIAQWLIKNQIHYVVSPEPLAHKGMLYALQAADIHVFVTSAEKDNEILDSLIKELD